MHQEDVSYPMGKAMKWTTGEKDIRFQNDSFLKFQHLVQFLLL